MSDTNSPPNPNPRPQTPYRQIRAHYDSTHITVYQAYSFAIASAAIKTQRLNASFRFSPTRMTWIKPSWCWMMYRSGYSLKDPNQAHILALKISHENFHTILSQACVVSGGHGFTPEEKKMPVMVQWDPERTPKLGILPYRSNQIGISGTVKDDWVMWIDWIEDVTERALGLKTAVEENPDVGMEELMERGLMPVETVYELPEELMRLLKMDLE